MNPDVFVMYPKFYLLQDGANSRKGAGSQVQLQGPVALSQQQQEGCRRKGEQETDSSLLGDPFVEPLTQRAQYGLITTSRDS